MQGTPKHLNTKEDYEYIRAHFAPEVWRPRFEALLDEQKQWFNTGPLADGDEGQTDGTRKIVEDQGMTGGPPVRYQFELRDDPNCLMLRLGYSAQEIKAVLEGE